MMILLNLSACSKSPDKAIAQMNEHILSLNIDKTNVDWKTSLTQPPLLNFSEGKTYLWMLKTNKGDIVIEFMHEHAPMHVSSTIFLTNVGVYNDTVFHRIIPGFMAQGGDPTGTGRGSPGYYYAGEFDDSVQHDQAGLLSMANRGPNTDGSQFFITFKETPWLDGAHTIFGKVIEGMEVLQEIEKAGSQTGRTSEEIQLLEASVRVL